MSRELVIAFVICFLGGPLIFAAILRVGPGVSRAGLLALAIAASVAAGFWLQSLQASLGALACLWLAWVLAVALVVQVLRRRVPITGGQRWITVSGALATTLPWFGLATARMMIS